VPIA